MVEGIFVLRHWMEKTPLLCSHRYHRRHHHSFLPEVYLWDMGGYGFIRLWDKAGSTVH